MTQAADAIALAGEEAADELNRLDRELTASERVRELMATENAALRSVIERLSIGPAPLVKGLHTAFAKPPAGFEFLGWTPAVRWNQLEPVRGQLNYGLIDSMIDQHPEGLRLRTMWGFGAPPWAMELWGSFPYQGWRSSGTAFCYWNPWAQDHHAGIQANLAARFDGAINLIFAAWPMTEFAEPFQRAFKNKAAFLAAGWTEAKDRACFPRMYRDMEVWKSTRVGVAYNPYQALEKGGNDVDFTIAMMNLHLDLFGSQAVLQNNSIGNSAWRSAMAGTAPHYLALYAALAQLRTAGATVNFQTGDNLENVDIHTTLDWAVQRGSLVETTPKLITTLGPDVAASYDAELKEAA